MKGALKCLGYPERRLKFADPRTADDFSLSQGNQVQLVRRDSSHSSSPIPPRLAALREPLLELSGLRERSFKVDELIDFGMLDSATLPSSSTDLLWADGTTRGPTCVYSLGNLDPYPVPSKGACVRAWC
jgi:hypothetical protein